MWAMHRCVLSASAHGWATCWPRHVNRDFDFYKQQNAALHYKSRWNPDLFLLLLTLGHFLPHCRRANKRMEISFFLSANQNTTHQRKSPSPRYHHTPVSTKKNPIAWVFPIFFCKTLVFASIRISPALGEMLLQSHQPFHFFICSTRGE